RGFEKGQALGQQIIYNSISRDLKRAEWVSEVVVEAFNSGIIKGDDSYLSKFANFALDGNSAGVEIDAGLGLTILNSDEVNRLNSDFSKLKNFVNNDKNKYVENNTKNGLDRGLSPEFIKIYEKKFKSKPD